MTAMAPSNLPPKGGWWVTSQVQQTRLVVGQSLPVPGYTISFVTGYGVNGSVFVPLGDYTPDAVKALLTQTVAGLDQVSQLTHAS